MLTYVAGFQANTQNYSDQLHATDEEMLKVAGALEETRAKLLEARAAEVKAKKELQDQLRVLEETATTRTKLTEELAEEKAKTAQAVTNLANATALATTARLKLEEELAEEKAKTAQALTERDDIATIKLKLEELNASARMLVSPSASDLEDNRERFVRLKLIMRCKPVRRTLNTATFVCGEYTPATEPSSPAAIGVVVNAPVTGFRDTSVPILSTVVAYVHWVPFESTIHGESNRIPAGAAVSETRPGTCAVARAGVADPMGATRMAATRSDTSPVAIRIRLVSESDMRPNSPLHNFSCANLSTATSNFVLKGGANVRSH